MQLVVIGSSNMDLVVKLKRLPRPGETVTGGQFFEKHGGKGANQAVAAARAGANVIFISCLGDDDFGKEMTRSFQQEGIDVSMIQTDDVSATGTALIMVDENGENSIAVAPGANHKLRSDPIKAEFHNGDGLIVLLQGEIQAEALVDIIGFMHSIQARIVVNLAPMVTLPLECLNKVGVLIVNEVEANDLMSIYAFDNNQSSVMESLNTNLKPTVIVTHGRHGVKYMENDVVKDQPAFEVTPIDTTAAGDVFCGALCSRLVMGESLSHAIRYGAAAAALATTVVGAQDSCPHKETIDQFLKANQRKLV